MGGVMLNGQTPQFANGDFENSPCDASDCSETSYDCIPEWSNFSPQDNLGAEKPLLHYDCIPNAESCGGNSALWLFSYSGDGTNTSASGTPITTNPLLDYSPTKFSVLSFDAYVLDYNSLGDLSTNFYFGGSHTELASTSNPILNLLGNSLTFTLADNSDCSLHKILLPTAVKSYEYVGFSLGDGVQALQNGGETDNSAFQGRTNVVIDNLELCDFLEFEQQESCADNEVCFTLNYNPECYDFSCANAQGISDFSLTIYKENSDVVEDDILIFSTDVPQEVCFDLPESGTYRLEMLIESCGTIYTGFHFNFDYQDPCVTTDITTDQTWTAANTGNNGHLTSGDIVVHSGATLTIEEGVEIAFCQGASLIVEANATLNLYGHLVACDEFWQGVDVYGLQSATTQSVQGGIRPVGKLRMYPKSLIKNALIAVDLSSANGAGGGIIQAEEAIIMDFYENGVHFAPFENHNPYTGYITSNFSYLRGCHFTENEDFVPTGFPLSMVYLEGVRGVSIKGCHFENNIPTAPFDFFGIGIRSRNSNFIATYLCNNAVPSPDPCTDYTRNHFKGLSFGIHNTNDDMEEDKGFVVRESEFRQCNFGIYNLNASFAKVVNNDFYLGDSKGLLTIHQFGTFFRGPQSGFTLEANHFLLDETVNNNNTIGSFCQNIGETNNVVKGNTYTGLLYGNLSNGKNFEKANIGLVYRCNENDNPISFSDFAVTDEGIRQKQAFIRYNEITGIPTYYPAGNYFTHANLSFSDFNNEGGPIDYYHADAMHGVPEEVPLSYTELTITRIPLDDERECATKYLSPGTPQEEIDIDGLIDEFGDHKNEWDIKRALYCDQITQGGSKVLSEKVVKGTESAAALKTDLLAASPYVSLEILSETLKSTQLGEADKMEVLLANPHAGYTPAFFAASGLTTAEIASIKAAMAGESDRSELELSIGYHRQQMDESSTAVIQEVLNESSEMEVDFVRNWYQQLSTPTTDYKLAAQYVNEGNYTAASNLLSTMSDKYCGWDASSALHQEMEDYIGLMTELHQTGVPSEKMPAGLLADFHDLLENATTSVRHKAEAVYASATGQDFFLDYKLPDGAQGLAREEISGKAETRDERVKILPQKIMVYPNPASNVVYFANLKGAAHLTIKDITGKIIQKMNIDDTSYQWNTTNLSNGIYIYTIYSDRAELATGKVMINK